MARRPTSKLDIDPTQRTAELSAILYLDLIKKGYLDSSHLQVAKNLGKFALALNVAKQVQVAFFDPKTTLIEQGVEIVIDSIISRLQVGPLAAVKAVELMGTYVAPVVIEEVEAAVKHIARTEQDILSHLSSTQQIVFQNEFTLSEEIQAAVGWVKCIKYLAEQSGKAKSWVAGKVQGGIDALGQTMQQAASVTLNEELAQEYREAMGVFNSINWLSDRIKKKGLENEIEAVVEQNYSLYSEDVPDTDETPAPSQAYSVGLYKPARSKTLDPQWSATVVGGTSTGLVIIAKVSMSLSAVSLGIGVAFFVACMKVSTILNIIRRKKFKKCEQQHQENLADINGTNKIYEQLVERYKDLYNITEADQFRQALASFDKEIESALNAIPTRLRNLNNRNKKIQKTLHRNEYKQGYRKSFDEMRAYYGNVNDVFVKMSSEISNNLQLLTKATLTFTR